MTTIYVSAILGLFAAVLFVLKWQLSRPIKKFLKRPMRQQLKPFDCLPCMSFWLAAGASVSLELIYGPSRIDFLILHTLTAAALAFVAALIFDK